MCSGSSYYINASLCTQVFVYTYVPSLSDLSDIFSKLSLILAAEIV